MARGLDFGLPGEWRTHCAYLDMPASAAHLNAPLLFVFPAALPPSPPFSLPSRPFASSHHLNYMCLEFVIPVASLSPLLCH